MLVANVPDFCVEEVSDHAMALLLASARRVVTFARSTRAGSWDLLGLGRGLPRLRGQRLGIVGFGNIARTLIPKARGLGLEVTVFTPRLAPARRGHRRRDDGRPRAPARDFGLSLAARAGDPGNARNDR